MVVFGMWVGLIAFTNLNCWLFILICCTILSPHENAISSNIQRWHEMIFY